MKKSLILLAVLAFAAGPGFAQTAAPAGAAPTPTHLQSHRVQRMKPAKTPEQSAEHHTAMLTKKLSLTAEQEAKVKPIMLAEAQAAQAIKAKYPDATQRPAMHQEMQASRATYQAQLQGVLSPDQLSKFTAMQQAHQHKNKGGRGAQPKVKS